MDGRGAYRRPVLDVQVIDPRDTLRPPSAMIGLVFGGEAVRRLGLSAVVVTILAVTGCGGGPEGDAAAKPTKSKSAAPSSATQKRKVPERSLQQAVGDLGFAVAPYKPQMQPLQSGSCIVHGLAPTRRVLERAEFEAIVGRLQKRGWSPEGPVDFSDDETYGKMSYLVLQSGEWEISLGSGPMPSEGREAYAPSEGLITAAISWKCTGT